MSADDEVTWERTGDGRLVAARDGGISLVLAMGDEAVPLPDGDVLIASAPLTPGGWLPADGAAWLRRPKALSRTPHPQDRPALVLREERAPAEPQVCGESAGQNPRFAACAGARQDPLQVLRGGEESVEELLGRGGGGQLTAAYALLGVGQDRPDGRVRVQGLQQRVAEHRPHPLDVLAAAPLDQRAAGGHGRLVPLHGLPDVLQALAGQPAAGQHRHPPGRRGRVGRAHHPHRAGEIPCGQACFDGALAVGLVDRDHVGQLEDALLDALQLVAGARQASAAGSESTMSATVTSDCPTPTVSTSTTS